MKHRHWGDILAGVFVLAVISLMVRPASLGPGLVRTLGDAMTALVSYVADPQTTGAAPAPTGPVSA